MQDQSRSSKHTAKRKRTGEAGRQGWVIGARVLNACGVEHIIRAMRHGYVQCSRPDCTEISNYRRKELRLRAELSSDQARHAICGI